jgi:O-antigen ligase
VLLAAAPTWPQLRAAATGLVAGATAAACASAFPGVSSLTGTAAAQRRDGAIVLLVLLALMALAALVTLRSIAAERNGTARISWLPNARRLPAVAVAAAALCVAGLVGGGLAENAQGSESAASTASRYASVSSVRYEYWRVGALAFTREPVRGLGAGGFRVFWREERRIPYSVTEVHSLPLEMAAELGLPGLLLFAVLIGAIGMAALQALRQGAPLAPGAAAVCVAWLLHATIDWDWQLPAVTLPAVVLAGGLLAASEKRLPGTADDWLAAQPREQEPITVSAG